MSCVFTNGRLCIYLFYLFAYQDTNFSMYEYFQGVLLATCINHYVHNRKVYKGREHESMDVCHYIKGKYLDKFV